MKGMKKKIKAVLSKMNFNLNRNPRIVKYRDVDPSKYIPEPYKAVFILSADFELAWAWRYSKAFQNPKEEAINRSRISRRNIPEILKLCDKYNIPITWATVGHLFLEECSRDRHLAHQNLRRIPYHENEYWKFDKGDWFQNDPCTNWVDAPEWYAPDLIRLILTSKVNHEIACHTFSHIDCRDDVCSREIFTGEVLECQKSVTRYGRKLETFIHPGHTIGNLDTLKELGFTSFRTDYENTLGYPIKHKNGLWELKSTVELAYRKEWSVKYHIYRYKMIIERALKYKRLCYCWFHLSMFPVFVEEVMPELFDFIASKKKKLWITTTKDYVNWLESVKNDQEK